ncbi:unnamed protein product, partial [Urochloa humidicola]
SLSLSFLCVQGGMAGVNGGPAARWWPAGGPQWARRRLARRDGRPEVLLGATEGCPGLGAQAAAMAGGPAGRGAAPLGLGARRLRRGWPRPWRGERQPWRAGRGGGLHGGRPEVPARCPSAWARGGPGLGTAGGGHRSEGRVCLILKIVRIVFFFGNCRLGTCKQIYLVKIVFCELVEILICWMWRLYHVNLLRYEEFVGCGDCIL